MTDALFDPETPLILTTPALKKRFPLLLFMAFYLAWALLTYADYGMTIDEPLVYARGMALEHHLFFSDNLKLVQENAHDPGLVLYDHFYPMVLSVLNPSANVDIYHFLNILAAFPLFAAVFELLLLTLGDPWVCLLGPLFLFLTPRFMGNIPFDPKDVPFATSYFLALTGIHLHLSHRPAGPFPGRILGLGLLFGLCQCSRPLGFTLYPIFFLDALYLFISRERGSASAWGAHLKESLLSLVSIFIFSAFIMMVTWPYLGVNFPAHLAETLKTASHFPWNNPVLFQGRQVMSTQLPWSYLPVWFLLTTPVGLLLLLLASPALLRPFPFNDLTVLLVLSLAVNGILVLLFHPVLYDGLRHYLFVLPLGAVLAAQSASAWIRRTRPKVFQLALLTLVALDLAFVGVHMARLHPYEYVYFNELAGGTPGSQGRFPNDYWGASLKEGVQWVEAQPPLGKGRKARIHANCNPFQTLCYLNDRVEWTDDPWGADYLVMTAQSDENRLIDPSRLVHQVEREGVPLCNVYRMY